MIRGSMAALMVAGWLSCGCDQSHPAGRFVERAEDAGAAAAAVRYSFDEMQGRPADTMPAEGTTIPDVKVSACACLPEPVWWCFVSPRSRRDSISIELTQCGDCLVQTWLQRGTAECRSRLSCEPGTFTVDDVLAALSHPDVVAARSGSTIYYGDWGIRDVATTWIDVGELRVGIGPPCGDADPDCVGAPDGIAALSELLGQIARQQADARDCSDEDGS